MPIVLRSAKGTPLTSNEVDGNFVDLDGRVTTAQTTANAAQPKEAGKGLSTNDLTNTLKTKLDGIASGATANATDAQLRDRATHTGTQLASTISNFATAALGIALTGLSVASGTAVVATDSLLQGIGKLQRQITDVVASIATKASKGANNDITSLSGLTTPLSVAQGGTGGNSQANAQAGLGLVKVSSTVDNTGGSLLTAGWGGLGGQLQNRVYTPDQMFTTQAGGSFAYGNNGGVYPSGVTDGALINMGYDTAGQFAYQILGDWRTGYLYRRGRASGASGAWGMIYDSVNASLDPASGGLMSYTVVSGYSIFKFASGVMIMQGQAGESGVMPANSINVKNITIPSGFISVNFIQPMAMVTPYNIYDLVGAPECIMPSITSLRLTIRTGPTSQNSAMAITIIGRWK